jgi:hypothetical protein
VKLRDEERERLNALIHKGKHGARQVAKARMLLNADASEAGEGWSDSQIATALDVSIGTVTRTRQQLVEERLGSVPTHKHSPASARKRIFDGAAEAKLVTVDRSKPPTGTEYVSPGDRPGKPLVSLRKTWERVCKMAKIDALRLHDLRHSYASVGAADGLSLHVIGALLGHSQPSTTARYAHLAASPLHEAADAIGARIVAALGDPRNPELAKLSNQGMPAKKGRQREAVAIKSARGEMPVAA